MKITAVETYPVFNSGRNWLFVTVDTDEAIWGVGESNLTESKKIAGWCETLYINLAPHNSNGPVSTAACLQLCLASPNVGVLELPRPTGSVSRDVFPEVPPGRAPRLCGRLGDENRLVGSGTP